MKTESESAPAPDTTQNGAEGAPSSWQAPHAGGEDTSMDHSGYNAGGDQSYGNAPMEEDNYGPINVKEDG
jgi:RNA-binding protein Musashi